jgi:hypothetical protein
MDRIRTETMRTKMGLKKDILQETEVQQLRWYGDSMRMENCKIAKGCRMESTGEKEAR